MNEFKLFDRSLKDLRDEARLHFIRTGRTTVIPVGDQQLADIQDELRGYSGVDIQEDTILSAAFIKWGYIKFVYYRVRGA